jgi:hypothetical protein
MLLIPIPKDYVHIIYLPAPRSEIIYLPPLLPIYAAVGGPFIKLLPAPVTRLYLPSSPNRFSLPVPNKLYLSKPTEYLALPEPTCSQHIIYLPGAIDPYYTRF